jgi:hypothetical protein
VLGTLASSKSLFEPSGILAKSAGKSLKSTYFHVPSSFGDEYHLPDSSTKYCWLLISITIWSDVLLIYSIIVFGIAANVGAPSV